MMLPFKKYYNNVKKYVSSNEKITEEYSLIQFNVFILLIITKLF